MRLVPLGIAFLLLAASPALAERPADVLARLRGTPSTNVGALGSAFPQQYVNAYRHATPPPIVIIVPRPRLVPTCAGGWLSVDGRPAPLGDAFAAEGSRGLPAPSDDAPKIRRATTLAPALPRK